MECNDRSDHFLRDRRGASIVPMKRPVHAPSAQLLFFLAVFVFIFAAAIPSSARSDQKPALSPHKPVTLHLFWGRGCPHCDQEKEFLAALIRKYPEVAVKEYEVWHNKENAAFFNRVMASAQVKSAGVPATIVGSRLFIGFSAPTAAAIEQAVLHCRAGDCVDAVTGLAQGGLKQQEASKSLVDLPLIGTVDPAAMSLPIFTIIIAGLDSFNPCAFFVLLFLLSLLIHARSRTRMLLIGGIFVLFSGVIYFVFMAAWLNIFLIIGQLTVITVSAGIIALLVAGINIKDFFYFGKGASLSIPEQAKPRLFERMRNLLKAPTLPAMISGAVVLAIMANAYELLCTAGFPMVYTRVLTLHKLSPAEYYLYLALYNFVYVIPLAVIVSIVTVTLGARKLTEWQGRKLKLMSGLMMLLLGGVILVEPALLNNILASVILLTAALVLSAVTIAVAKKVRPAITRE